MPTPKQLEEAEAEADRLIAEQAAETQARDSEPDPIRPDPLQAVEEPAESGEPASKAEAEPVVVGGEGEDSPQAQIAALEERLTKLQAAHDTLRGKTYAEVPRVLAENRSLLQRLEEAERKLAEKAAAPVNKQPTAKSSELLAKLKESVNGETVDIIHEYVSTQVDERLGERVGSVEGTVATLQRDSQAQAEAAYVTRLTELVPDWQAIVASPEYAEFLSGTDELSGEQLHNLATRALNRLDAVQQSKFFKRFAATKPAAAAPSTKPPGKEVLLAPRGAARTSDRDTKSDAQDRFTQKQLDQFNRTRRTMSPADEAAMEARIDRAIQNRWIDP